MTTIQLFKDAMEKGDYLALGKLFSDTGVYCDYCPKEVGQAEYHSCGPQGIEMFFHNHFVFRKFQVNDPVIQSDTRMYFYALYGNYHLRALATIEEYAPSGLIQRLVVRPA